MKQIVKPAVHRCSTRRSLSKSVLDQIQAEILSEENVRKCINLLTEETHKSKPEKTAEEAVIKLAIQAVEANVRRWEETLEKGPLGLEECAGWIKELRRQREDLLSRKINLQKKIARSSKYFS